MNFKPDQLNTKKESPSLIDKMVLEPHEAEKLPTVEKMLNDIEQAVISGSGEAATLIRELGITEKIKAAKERILLLNKNDVVTFLNVVKYHTDIENPEYSEIEKALQNFIQKLGEYNTRNKRIRILVESSNISEKNNFIKARTMATLTHEVLHDLARNIELQWLNEGITERLTQSLIADIVGTSKEWEEIFEKLDNDENDQISFGAYEQERSQLAQLCENIRDNCFAYKDLLGGNYKDLSRAESIVFTENFGRSYFTGDLSVLENNLKQVGYSSIAELKGLDPDA